MTPGESDAASRCHVILLRAAPHGLPADVVTTTVALHPVLPQPSSLRLLPRAHSPSSAAPSGGLIWNLFTVLIFSLERKAQSRCRGRVRTPHPAQARRGADFGRV